MITEIEGRRAVAGRPYPAPRRLHRETTRCALAEERCPITTPARRRPPSVKDDIERLLRADHPVQGTPHPRADRRARLRGRQALLDDHLRKARPHFTPRRTYQRTIYRPGKICQFDLWEAKFKDPGRPRAAAARLGVACALGYSRAGPSP